MIHDIAVVAGPAKVRERMTHGDARRATFAGVIEPPVGIRDLNDVEPAHRRVHGCTRSGDGIAKGDGRWRIRRPNGVVPVRAAAPAAGHEGNERRMRHELQGVAPRQAKYGVWMAESESFNGMRNFYAMSKRWSVYQQIP